MIVVCYVARLAGRLISLLSTEQHVKLNLRSERPQHNGIALSAAEILLPLYMEKRISVYHAYRVSRYRKSVAGIYDLYVHSTADKVVRPRMPIFLSSLR